MNDEAGDIISNIVMAYNVIKKADNSDKKKTVKSPKKPKVAKEKEIKKKKVLLKTEETQTLPRGQIEKMQKRLYLERIRKTKNIRISKTKKEKKQIEIEKRQEVANKFEDFLLEKKCTEIENKYLILRMFGRWIKRTKAKIEENKNETKKYNVSPKNLSVSTPNLVVDEKRDTICQDENSLVVNQQMPVNIQLKLSETIENSTSKFKSLIQSLPVLHDDKPKNPDLSKSATTFQPKTVAFAKKEDTKENEENEQKEKNDDNNKNVTEQKPEDVKPSKDGESSDGLYDFDEPVLDDSDQDLFEDADNIIKKVSLKEETKTEVNIKSDNSSSESNKDKSNADDGKKDKDSKNNKEKNRAEDKIIPVSPDDPKYLEYTNKLLAKYEKEDFQLELPRYTRVSKDRHQIPELSDSDSFVDSNQSLTEMKLTESQLDEKPSTTTMTGNYSQRIAALINYGKDLKTNTTKPDDNSATESLLQPSPLKKTKPEIVVNEIVDIKQENQEEKNEEPVTVESILKNDKETESAEASFDMKAGEDLIAQADALLYEEEEEDSEIFELPPKKARFSKTMEMLDYDHEIDISNLKCNKKKFIIEEEEDYEEEINDEVLQNIEAFIDKLRSSNKPEKDAQEKENHILPKKENTTKVIGEKKSKVTTVEKEKEKKKKKSDLELQLERLKALKKSSSSDSDSTDYELLDENSSPKKKNVKLFVSVNDAVNNGETILNKKVKKIVYTAVVSNSSDADMAVLELDEDSSDPFAEKVSTKMLK